MATAEPSKFTPFMETQVSHHDSIVSTTPQLVTKALGEHLDEFPLQVFGDLCWGKDSFAGNPKLYIWELSKEDKASLNQALHKFKGT